MQRGPPSSDFCLLSSDFCLLILSAIAFTALILTGKNFTNKKIKITNNQLTDEFKHLKNKLKTRDPKKYKKLLNIKEPETHPLFALD